MKVQHAVELAVSAARKRLVGFAVLMSVVSPTPASADTLDSLDPDTFLHLNHCVGPCIVETVIDFQLRGTAIDVTAWGRVFGENALGFNIAGSEDGLTISNLSPGYTVGGRNEAIGPYGSFEYVLDGPLTPPRDFTPRVTFTLTRTSGFSSEADVLAPNALGYLAAGHSGYTFMSQTDFQAGTTVEQVFPPVVPEPGTLLLVSTGLIITIRARRRQT
jgi:hypothetical protein